MNDRAHELVFGKGFKRDAEGRPVEAGHGNLTDRANPKPAVSWPSGYSHPPGSKLGTDPVKVEKP